jgi:outer membrane protein TolC
MSRTASAHGESKTAGGYETSRKWDAARERHGAVLRIRTAFLPTVLVVLGWTIFNASRLPAQDSRLDGARQLTLSDCIAIALHNQPAIQAQQSALGAAEEQRNIARSHFFPQVNFATRYTLLDEPRSVDVPSPLTGELADLVSDAGAFFGIARQAGSAAALGALDNPNLPPFSTAKQAALGSLPGTIRADLLGENFLTTQLQLVQPLWTGGKIRYRTEQAKLGTHAAVADVAKAEQETVFNVTHAYLAIQLAHGLLTEPAQ